MVLAIIFLVLFAIFAGVSIYFTVSMVKTPMIEIDYKKLLSKIAICVGGAIISFLVASFGFYMWLKATPDAWHVVQLVFGAILFVGGLFTAINCFILHYYGHNIPEKLNRWFFIIQIVGFSVATFALIPYTNGLAPYLTYPLVNGISFTDGFVTPISGRPNIAFYALCILSGAILVYFVCDHYMYKEYGEHGILESTFFVAFPAGIIGARIWYVVGNWAREFDYGRAMTSFNGIQIWAPLAIWEGGITILGGAIMGIVAGAAWYMWRNKGKSIWIPFDLVLPTILIAQAIGRWGNFFNCEVHGLAVSLDNWKWLPEIVWRNGQYSSTSGFAGEGQFYVPLFFIESVVNLLGYFVLGHLFGKALRRYAELGDVGFGYIIWYGLTRVLMEPLRSTDYQMGSNGYWSWVWSMIFVFVGTLLIVLNHTIRYFVRKKEGKRYAKARNMVAGLVATAIICCLSIILLSVGFYLISQNTFKSVVAYNGFNIGLIILILGASNTLCLGISLPTLFSGLKYQKEAHE